MEHQHAAVRRRLKTSELISPLTLFVSDIILYDVQWVDSGANVYSTVQHERKVDLFIGETLTAAWQQEREC